MTWVLLLAATAGYILVLRLLWTNCYWRGRILGTLAVLLGPVPGWIFILASWLDPRLAHHAVVHASWTYVLAFLTGLAALSLLGRRRSDRLASAKRGDHAGHL